jgi:two-component system nitrogen regulation sensor histidine kinase NtrY
VSRRVGERRALRCDVVRVSRGRVLNFPTAPAMNEETPPQTQSDETDEPKARRRVAPWFFGGLVLVLLAALIALQVSGVWEFVTPDNAADTLVLYALSTLNFVAFVVFSFIFVRSLLKLRSERRERVLGSKIKTRLVVYFIVVSLLPITAMAVFSYLFFNRTLEKMFGRVPEDIVQEARLARDEDAAQQARAMQDTLRLAAAAVSRHPEGDVMADVGAMLKPGDFGAITITPQPPPPPPQDTATPQNVEGGSGASADPKLEATFNEFVPRAPELAQSGQYVLTPDGIILAAASLADGRTLVAARRLQADTRLARIVSGADTFEQLRRRQRRVRLLGLSTLGLLTLLLVFAATWAAIHLARGIGTPIRALAEAADEVARGNLAHRVNVTGDDELAVLADTFNGMTAQLEANRAHIEANAAKLSETNLALDERRGYIETVLESLSTGVVSLDADNRLTTINAAAIQMLRLGTAPARGTPLAEIVNTEDRAVLDRVLARARRTGRAAWQMELRRGATSERGMASDGVAASDNSTAADDGAAVDGGVVPVALTATAFGAATDGARGVVLVIEDLSELLAAQRAAAWSEVARRMAHEIKNPLTPIQLSAERIARNFPGVSHANGGGVLDLDERGSREVDERVARIVDECTRTITREVAGLKAMVDEFSRFARLPRARLEAGDLNEVVRQAVALYEDRLDEVRLDVLLAPTLPAAMLDAEQLRRVFVNLLDNALEATAHAEGERRITVATAHDPSRGLLLAEVADTGHGIAREDFQRLFQPYFSTRGRGTGLGLAIVQHIINDHGGRIRAEQNRPRGAKFLVEIPIGEEQRSEVRGQRSEEDQRQEQEQQQEQQLTSDL